MQFRRLLTALALTTLIGAGPALAADDAGGHDHGAMGHDMNDSAMNHGDMNHGDMNHGAGHAMAADGSASTKAFVAANAKMHADMAIEYSGNADVDFVRGMIPHHQGAIDMAKIALEHGKDPGIRKLAEEIIKAQEAEIAMMKEWLAKNAPN